MRPAKCGEYEPILVRMREDCGPVGHRGMEEPMRLAQTGGDGRIHNVLENFENAVPGRCGGVKAEGKEASAFSSTQEEPQARKAPECSDRSGRT